MAFPVSESENTSSLATAGTSHVVNLPTGIVSGDLILILLDKGSTAATFNALAGWTEVVDENSANGITIWARKSDGTEGSTVTFTSSASTRSAHISYRISGAADPATQLPELSTVATGANANPNATTCTPTGGAKDYLWITMFGSAGEQADDGTLVSATPTNYANTLTKTCGTAGTNLGGCIGAARRTNNAASEDASAWTISETLGWRAYTIAIHPGANAANAPAGDAAGSGTAPQPVSKVASNAPDLTGTGTAPAATASVQALAGLAAAIGTAPAAAVPPPVVYVNWQTGDVARFTERVISNDVANGPPDYEMDISGGRGRVRAISGPSTPSNHRELWELELTQGNVEKGRTTFYSGDAFISGTVSPQHGLAFRITEDVSRRSAIVVDNNILFGAQWAVWASVWASDLDGSNFGNRQSGVAFEPLLRTANVTAASRTSNVVTLTITPVAGVEWFTGDRINTNLTDDTYDGAFIVSTVSGDGTTITYSQTAADDADGGTGTISKTFPYDVEARINPAGSTKVDVRAKPRERPHWPTWTTYDPTAGLYVATSGSGRPLATPDHASLDITGDLCVMAELTLPDWQTTSKHTSIMTKFDTSGQMSFIFRLEGGAPAGRLALQTSANGSTVLTHISTAAVTFADGERAAVAALIDVDNGAGGRTVRFYTAPSINGTWTQLGTDVTVGATTSIFSSTSQLEFASQQISASSVFQMQSGGRFHAGIVRSGGLTGTPVADWFGPNYPDGATSMDCRAGRTFTVASPGVITNLGMPPAATALAYSVDVNESGSESTRALLPTPTDPKKPKGLVTAHLGTDSRSACVFEQTIFGDFPDVEGQLASGAGSSAQPIPSVGTQAGQASATGTAPQPIASVQALAGVASAAGDAPQPTVTTGGAATNAPAGLAAATGTANPATVTVGALPAGPAATGTANQPAANIGPKPAVASGIGTAPPAISSVAPKSGVATATGTSDGQTVQTGAFTNAPAGLAAAAGTSPQPVIRIDAPAGFAAGLGTAPQPTVTTAASTNAPAGLAAAAAAAFGPKAAIQTAAGFATAAGQAFAALGLQGEIVVPPERIYRVPADPLVSVVPAGPAYVVAEEDRIG